MGNNGYAIFLFGTRDIVKSFLREPFTISLIPKEEMATPFLLLKNHTGFGFQLTKV
jgi:hypothetical protein